jgi:hypothetical protein
MKLLIAFLFFILTQPSYSYEALPKDAFTFDFNIRTVHMTREKEEKLYGAIDLLRLVFASPEFKHKILKHKFNGRFAFAQNKGFTNKEIYRRILAGVEKLYPYYNNAMDVEVELYSDYKSNVLGYTKPSTKRIWMNTKYFNKHTYAEVASHLTHEWLHKLGFDHEKDRCPDRQYSVPYAVGYIVREIAGKLNEDFYQKGSQKR